MGDTTGISDTEDCWLIALRGGKGGLRSIQTWPPYDFEKSLKMGNAKGHHGHTWIGRRLQGTMVAKNT